MAEFIEEDLFPRPIQMTEVMTVNEHGKVRKLKDVHIKVLSTQSESYISPEVIIFSVKGLHFF